MRPDLGGRHEWTVLVDARAGGAAQTVLPQAAGRTGGGGRAGRGGGGRSWRPPAQGERLNPYFPKPRGRPRVDDRRVLSGILHVLRNGLRWQDAPPVYGPHKTLYNRFARWSRLGVFARIFRDLARPGPGA